MTITFNCPGCGGLCGFDEKYTGRRARCLKCNQVFIIPSKDGEKAQEVEADKGVPVEGFYETAFSKSWKIFLNPSNAAGLVFAAAMVCLEFFVGHTDYSFDLPGFRVLLPTGLIAGVVSRGCLFWYYMETIQWSACEIDELPDVDIGAGLEFFWNIIKCTYLFVVALIVAELPFWIVMAILKKAGLEWMPLFHVLMLMGMFIFPMVILTLCLGRELWMVFRVDYIFVPIFKAFLPYLTASGLVMAAWFVEWQTVGYGQLKEETTVVVAMHLFFNLCGTALTIIAMRSIGLFSLHYGCYLPQQD